MRIVAKIAAAGESGVSQFPVANASTDDCLDAAGRLDESKAIKALAVDQVQIASTDDRAVLAFALEYLRLQQNITDRMTSVLKGFGECTASVADPSFSRDSCARKMRKGRVVFVRTDITSCRNGLHVKLSVQNPRGVVGSAERLAREYAVMCARILIYLRDGISTSAVTLIEGDGADGIFAEAADRNRRYDSDRLRAYCPRLKPGDFCSPVDPSCPLYSKGKCVPNPPDEDQSGRPFDPIRPY